jgi:4-diphosphocytidyl-2-C-methyl-D-erythritol kinase
VIEERAHAKVNLVLRVGVPRADGMHPLCSLFASLELADVVRIEEASRDEVVCPGVEGQNLALAAASAFRATGPGSALPPLRIEIEKRIPVAAGLAGGSADAAAVLRAANAITGSQLSVEQLRKLAIGLGSDVPSQVLPSHSIVSGIGEVVEPLDLPAMTLVLVPQEEGLSTTTVFTELDRIGAHADSLDPEPLRRLAAGPLTELADGLVNDLELAALSLRPELAEPIGRLRGAGALAALVSGSGPTTFGVFGDRDTAERAAEGLPGAIVTGLNS